MKKKYYKYFNHLDACWYGTVDNMNKPIKKISNSACFWALTRGAVEGNTAKIIIYCPKQYMGYDENIIKRWVDLLTENGFQISYDGFVENSVNNESKSSEKYYFSIDIDKDSNKFVINGTLNLIRYLWLQYGAWIPDRCLQIMEENPEKDFLTAMQEAHYLGDYDGNAGKDGYSYLNTNHCLKGDTGAKNFAPDSIITKDTFDKRCITWGSFFQNSQQHSLTSSWGSNSGTGSY